MGKTRSNITRVCQEILCYCDEYPDLLMSEIRIHFSLRGQRLLSYDHFIGVYELVYTCAYLASKKGCDQSEIYMSCEPILDAYQQRKPDWITVITLPEQESLTSGY